MHHCFFFLEPPGTRPALSATSWDQTKLAQYHGRFKVADQLPGLMEALPEGTS